MIPPLVSYPNITEFNQAVRDLYTRKERKFGLLGRTVEDVQAEATRLWEAGLPPIAAPRLLSLLLGISPRLIPRMVSFPAKYWREFQLPKKSGGMRTIRAPRVFLKTVQIYLLQNVLLRRPVSPYAFGFLKGRGAASCAAMHQGKQWVLRLDIHDFFGSIRSASVSHLFQDVGFNLDVAGLLAGICTLDGVLPQGAPTSPHIADLIFGAADLRLAAMASQYDLIYSRYADDMIFSGDRRPPEGFAFGVIAIIDSYGLSLNHEKTKLFGPNEAHRVLGFVVNEKVHPTRSTRRILRAKFHNLANGQLHTDETLAQALGWASYANSFDADLGRRYLSIAREAEQKPDLGPQAL